MRNTYSSLLCGVEEKETNVGGLNEASDRVDCDDKHLIALKQCIIYPKHCTEQTNHIRCRLKSFT